MQEGDVEQVSREWIKYVCLNKAISRVTSLEEGRDKEKGGRIYLYIKNCPRINPGMQQCGSGGGVDLVPQHLSCSSRYTVTWCRGVSFGVGWSCFYSGYCGPIPEAPPWWWWGEKWRPPPSLFSMTWCPKSLLWIHPHCVAVCLAPPTPLPQNLAGI